MKKVFATSIFSFMAVMLLLSVINTGCSSRHLDQNQQSILEQPQENAPEQRQKTVISAKPKETSIFTVIEIEDLEYPTLAASIRLPFRASSNNSVVLSGEHAYLTTERHLHVIDVSIPQRPIYLISLAFEEQIGKALVSGDHIVITNRKKFHLVDVSQPSVPVIQSTVHLPHRHTIKDFDTREAHLYVMGANDFLYIFSVIFGQARLVKAIEMSSRWWLLSPKVGGSEVEQILLSIANPIPGGILEPLLSQRGFLQLRSSKQEKVRASSEFLVVESLKNPTCDLLIFDAHRINDHGVSSSMGCCNVRRDWRNYLSATGLKTLTHGKPTIAYVIENTGKMQQIAQEGASETIDVDDKRLVGPITDFQISKDLLYIVNAKGFLSIIRISKVENHVRGDRDKLLSITPLQASRPMSIAVGEGYACVLAALED